MDRQEIIARLRDNEPALRARGDARQDSDTDILIDIDPQTVVSVYDYVGLKTYIAGLFDGSVDVVDREALNPRVRPAALADAFYALERAAKKWNPVFRVDARSTL